jgi:hypothetical protein
MKDIPGHTGEEGSSGEFAFEQRLILNVRDFRTFPSHHVIKCFLLMPLSISSLISCTLMFV